ncbi:hypothetical protein CCAND93_810016 [Capnocytophaga canis]|nr:hypothetical protein CCAND93_810016 [Capnocytophaga canis]
MWLNAELGISLAST